MVFDFLLIFFDGTICFTHLANDKSAGARELLECVWILWRGSCGFWSEFSLQGCFGRFDFFDINDDSFEVWVVDRVVTVVTDVTLVCAVGCATTIVIAGFGCLFGSFD